MAEPLPASSGPWLAERARRDPTTLAPRAGAATWMWGGLAERVERLAGRFAALGLSPGDRVAVVMEPSARLVEIVHAAQRAGLTLVLVNTRWSAPEIATVLAHAAPRLVLHDPAYANTVIARNAPALDARGGLDGVTAAAVPPPAAIDAGAVQTILYTSGTTGHPKGVMLTHGNHAASACASRRRLGVRAGDRWLCALPLHHVGGLSIVMRSVLDGIPLVLHERFDARAVWTTIVAERITLLSLVPTMLHRMLADEQAERVDHALRCVLVGGAALDPALHARARACGLPVVATYGLTEAASQVATAMVGDARADVGPVLPGTTVRIADPDPHGQGEILVAGPTVMAGYFRDPAATAAALRDGWLHTGDVGRVDADGRLTILDRRTDVVVTGGENVYPSAVETVLLAHPDVAEAGVYGVDDPEWGKRVHAAVVLRAGATLDAAAVQRWCRERLAGYATPRVVVAVAALPRTVSGKLRRGALGGVAASREDNGATDPANRAASSSVGAARTLSPSVRRT